MAFQKKKNDDLLYRIYVTDTLKAIAHNTSLSVNGGLDIKARYFDLVEQSKNPKEERTEEEIIENLKQKLKGNK